MRVIGGNVARRFVALVAGLGLVLAACGGGDGPGGQGGAAGGGEADPEGVVRLGYDLVGTVRGRITWDPTEVTTSLTDDALLYLVYGRLMRPTQDGGLEPDLAESATVVDPSTIEIAVRDGVTFHDGTPFDAEAVAAGLERSLAARNTAGFGTAFFDLESVEVRGPTTVTLTIPNGTAASWADTFLGRWETTIVPPDADFSRPVGAGPMTVTEYVREQSVVLERYDGYWDADSILVGGMELVHVPADQGQAGIQALRAGQVDIVTADTSQMPALTGHLEPLVTPDPNRMSVFQVCKRDGPLADADVRRAINMAIDRDAINEAVFAGTSEPATQPWPEGHRFHNPDVADELAYDPEAARELLEEAGYGDGFTFDLYVIQGAGMPETAEVIQQQLAEVGVTMDIVPAVDYVQDFLVAQRPGAGLVPATSPDRLKLLQWTGESVGNACRYDDPELNALAEELAAVSDSSGEAVDLWYRIDQMVVEDALGVFLFFGSSIAAYDAERLGGAAVWPQGAIVVPDVRETSVNAGS